MASQSLLDALKDRIPTVNNIGALLSVGAEIGSILEVRHPKRGGLFTYADKTSSLATDNGIVHQAKDGGFWVRQYSGPADLAWFKGYGDGANDDTNAFINALNSPNCSELTIAPTSVHYTLSSVVNVSSLSGKTIHAKGAKIRQTGGGSAGSAYQRAFLVINSNNLTINGGSWAQLTVPTANAGASQHIFEFVNCTDVLLDNVHVHDSAEMGIAFSSCTRVTVRNSTIERCYRDGTFAQNSWDVTYHDNIYRDIKDDAMSCHDVGVASYRAFITNLGYAHAGNFKAYRNQVYNTNQGLASIGCTSVTVENNYFERTVLAAIAITTVYDYFNNSFDNHNPQNDATANHISIINNTCWYACSDTLIMGQLYHNYGQAGTGRAAIAILSSGQNSQMFQAETVFLNDVSIHLNKVFNSGANGLLLHLIDRVKWVGNHFQDCAGPNVAASLSGDVVEVWSVNETHGDATTILDTRATPLHHYGICYQDATGVYGNETVTGYTAGVRLFTTAKRPTPLYNPLAYQKTGKSEIQVSNGGNAFAFPHGAPFTPTSGYIHSNSDDADESLIKKISFDETSCIIIYKQNIPEGTALQWWYGVYA